MASDAPSSDSGPAPDPDGDAATDAEGPSAARLPRLTDSSRYRLARRLYHRHETVAPPLLFLGGVAWDAATLRRIDALVDNAILGLYLVLLGGFVVVAALRRSGRPVPDTLAPAADWAAGAIQFLAGGLFSAYVVYYTQSASLTSASLFLVVLVGVLVANELVWSRTINVYVLVGVYFLAVFCYFTFALPIVVGAMGTGVFLASGLLAAGLVGLLVLYLDRRGAFASTRSFLGALGVVLALLATVNLFYLQHWIPPVPLALRHGGIYENVARDGDAFLLRYRKASAWALWEDTDQEVVPYAQGDTVYCFAAVFAPTELQTRIYHRWARWSDAREAWIETDRIGYRVVGGRLNGYRGTTFKTHLRPGRWRVVVETAEQRPIARLPFTVVPADSAQLADTTVRRYR
jgi:hypothetical protein